MKGLETERTRKGGIASNVYQKCCRGVGEGRMRVKWHGVG